MEKFKVILLAASAFGAVVSQTALADDLSGRSSLTDINDPKYHRSFSKVFFEWPQTSEPSTIAQGGGFSETTWVSSGDPIRVAKTGATGEYETYLQGKQSFRAFSDIDPTRPFCRLNLAPPQELLGSEGANPPGADDPGLSGSEISDPSRLVVATSLAYVAISGFTSSVKTPALLPVQVTMSAVDAPGDPSLKGQGSWTHTVIGFSPEQYVSWGYWRHFSDKTTTILEKSKQGINALYLDCKSPSPMDLEDFTKVTGLNIFKRAFHPIESNNSEPIWPPKPNFGVEESDATDSKAVPGGDSAEPALPQPPARRDGAPPMALT